MERSVTYRDGSTSVKVSYAVTSLGPDRADEAQVLRFLRGHWSIEVLHHIRDTTDDEDRCRIRTANEPQVMAALRNLAAALAKRLFPTGTLPDSHRYLMMHHMALLDLLGA